MSVDSTIKYATLYLDSLGTKPTKIAKELGITAKVVKEILKQQPKPVAENTNNIKTTSSPVNSKNLMIRETAVKGTKSVAIMTKAASEVNDEFKKQIPDKITSRTTKNAIYHPFPQKNK